MVEEVEMSGPEEGKESPQHAGRIHSDPTKVAARLRELGLSVELLEQALRQGQVAQDLCTPNHPSNYPGVVAYGETNGALRGALKVEGWIHDNRFGICKIVAPGGEFSITAISGDENTGDELNEPMTKGLRGPKAMEAVIANGRQLTLFPAEAMLELTLTGELPPVMWYLLFNRSSKEILRAELSLPTQIDSNGVIVAWAERIILPEMAIPNGWDTGQQELEGTDIDVDVRRRA
jgi:hypothetical protein